MRKTTISVIIGWRRSKIYLCSRKVSHWWLRRKGGWI